MDIQVSSNFERLLFEAYGRDAAQVRALMASLAQSRRFSMSTPALAGIRALFSAGRADEDETAATIRTDAARDLASGRSAHRGRRSRSPRRKAAIPTMPMVVLGTAHPAKFPDAVEAACGMRPALPDWLADLPSAQERVATMPADQAAVEKFILAASRAAREGAAA